MSETAAKRLDQLVEKARNVRMTDEERAEQRRSFAYGNAAFENPLITKQMIRDEEGKLARHGK